MRPDSPSESTVPSYHEIVSNILATPLNSTNGSDLTTIILAEEESDDDSDESRLAPDSVNMNPEKSFVTTCKSKDTMKLQDSP